MSFVIWTLPKLTNSIRFDKVLHEILSISKHYKPNIFKHQQILLIPEEVFCPSVHRGTDPLPSRLWGWLSWHLIPSRFPGICVACLFFLKLYNLFIANFLNRQMLKSQLTKQMFTSCFHKLWYNSLGVLHLVTWELRVFPSCNATISICSFQVHFERKTWEERGWFLIALAIKLNRVTSAHGTWQKNKWFKPRVSKLWPYWHLD